jgi:hypothetical protein
MNGRNNGNRIDRKKNEQQGIRWMADAENLQGKKLRYCLKSSK